MTQEPTDDELLTIYSMAEGDGSSYDGWLALWRAGRAADPSPEEIEAAAIALYRADVPSYTAHTFEAVPFLGTVVLYRDHARAALLAARDVRNTK